MRGIRSGLVAVVGAMLCPACVPIKNPETTSTCYEASEDDVVALAKAAIRQHTATYDLPGVTADVESREDVWSILLLRPPRPSNIFIMGADAAYVELSKSSCAVVKMHLEQ